MPLITTFRSNLISKGYTIVAGSPRTFHRSTSRDYFMVVNKDASTDVNVAFGTNPDSGDFFNISAGGYFEPSFTPVSDITLAVESGSLDITIITDEHNSTV